MRENEQTLRHWQMVLLERIACWMYGRITAKDAKEEDAKIAEKTLRSDFASFAVSRSLSPIHSMKICSIGYVTPSPPGLA